MAVNANRVLDKIEKAGISIPALWNQPETGKILFDFMKSVGMKPHHKLLDIGCGPLRAGVHFVDYLDSGNYYGIDKNCEYLQFGNLMIEFLGIDKEWTLKHDCDFDFSFGVKFDYALAGSLFTHLSNNKISRCLINLKKALRKKGEFYATFFMVESDPPKIAKNLFRYDFNVMRDLAKEASMSAELIGDFGHPNKRQSMIKYIHEKTT